MRARDLFYLAFKSFFSSRIASTLVILVIAVSTGVSATLISQTAGLVKAVKQDILYLGPNTVLVENAGNVNLPNGYEIPLNSTLVNYFARIPHVKDVCPVIITNATLEVSGYRMEIDVVGIPNYTILGKYNVVYGKLATPANVGIMLPYSLFNSPGIIGKEAVLNVSGHVIVLKVVGIINYSTVQLLKLTIPSKDAVVPLKVLQSALNVTQYKLVVIKVDSPKYDGYVASYIKSLLGPKVIVSGVGFQGVSYAIYYSNLLVVSAEQLAEAYLKSLNINEGLSQFISVVSSVISIASITLVLTLSVFGQMKDIGVFRTLGMDNRDLALEKLVEALYGGLIGSGLGISIAFIVGNYVHVFSSAFAYSPVYSLPTVLGLFALGVLTAALGSVYPILWIVRQTPAETIRRGEL